MTVNAIEQGISQKWKDRFQYGAAGFLIITAVTLAFVSFIITLTVGAGVIAWGGLSMGTALTLIGGGMYFHNQLVTFETNANRKMEEVTTHVEKEIRRMNQKPSRYSRMSPEMPEKDYFDPEEQNLDGQ
jgi:hypothetical protein